METPVPELQPSFRAGELRGKMGKALKGMEGQDMGNGFRLQMVDLC